MSYPENDNEFRDTIIGEVKIIEEGYYKISCEDSWSIWIPSYGQIPLKGQQIRFYGKGIGYPIRGIYINGYKVYYRTVYEDAKYHEEQTYGKDAKEWLARWDEGRPVWTIEMGGLGPGYEQAIQVTVAEVLRHLIDNNYDHAKWKEKEVWEHDKEQIRNASFDNKVIMGLGLSGAQYGAAASLATSFYMRGPIEILSDEKIKDRHIMVSKNFP